MKALTGRVMRQAKRIVQDMYDWYNARDLEHPLDEVFRQLQNTLFKNVIAPVEEDVWRRRDSGGASQPRAQGETHLVVTREHVARQLGLVIPFFAKDGSDATTCQWRPRCEKTWRPASWRTRRRNFMILRSNRLSKKTIAETEKESSRESIPGGVGTCKG